MESETLEKGDLEKGHPPQRDRMGRLLSGHGMGRKKGSISAAVALRDRFITTIIKLDDEDEYKGDYVLWFARKYPDKFMVLVASLLPKQLKIEQEHHHVHVAVMDLPEADRAKVFDECRRRIADIRGDVIDGEVVKPLNE